jgi:hypothetical protein
MLLFRIINVSFVYLSVVHMHFEHGQPDARWDSEHAGPISQLATVVHTINGTGVNESAVHFRVAFQLRVRLIIACGLLGLRPIEKLKYN